MNFFDKLNYVNRKLASRLHSSFTVVGGPNNGLYKFYEENYSSREICIPIVRLEANLDEENPDKTVETFKSFIDQMAANLHGKICVAADSVVMDYKPGVYCDAVHLTLDIQMWVCFKQVVTYIDSTHVSLNPKEPTIPDFKVYTQNRALSSLYPRAACTVLVNKKRLVATLAANNVTDIETQSKSLVESIEADVKKAQQDINELTVTMATICHAFTLPRDEALLVLKKYFEVTHIDDEGLVWITSYDNKSCGYDVNTIWEVM